jgi:hypothetical protein
MLASVALGQIPKGARQIRRLIIDTVFRLPQKNCRISILFDIDIEDNLIFQRLIVKFRLFPERVDRLCYGIDG